MMLEKTIDTTVRGVVYEAGGTVAPVLLAAGGRSCGARGGSTRSPWACWRPTRADATLGGGGAGGDRRCVVRALADPLGAAGVLAS